MRQNTISIRKQSNGVGQYFTISLGIESGDHGILFAEGVDKDGHVRGVVTNAIDALLANAPDGSIAGRIVITDIRWIAVDTTDDQIWSATMACLGQLLFEPSGGVIRHECRNGRWYVFLDEWQLYPLWAIEDVNRAIVLYFGWKLASYPDKDETRVIKHFGHAVGRALIASVCAIASDMADFVPDGSTGHDLVKAINRAAKHLVAKYPWPDEDALAALGWYYSYEWK